MSKTIRKITIRALWGNDDAVSTIKISPRQWKKIQASEEFEKGGWAYYEGRRFSVGWYFNNRNVTIYADDQELILKDPIENLYLD
jgi:phage pi2 protein 07